MGWVLNNEPEIGFEPTTPAFITLQLSLPPTL